MQILISNYSQISIYEQIKNQVKELILMNTLQEGELLPSIRALASELHVGVITVKRAYEELEKEGFIFNKQGKGCFVKKLDRQQLHQEYQKQVEAQIKSLCAFCKSHVVEKEEVLQLLNEHWRDE